MATYYVDPIGGNDASAGTSFATRWQSLTSGATAARIAPGDTIRVIASPDPVDSGISGTWNSIGVTLASPATANIYTSGAWTAASANVTLTTSTSRKLGATSVSIAPAAAFTTGKAAYLTIASTDFSAYQQVSFWIQMSAGSMTAAGDIFLALCSDTTGDTIVNAVSVPRMLNTSQWHNYTVDLAGSLGSAIQSIALYVNVDRGAQTFLLNNVIAVKASSSADSISLTSLLGRGGADDPWFSVQSIDGTSIIFDGAPNSATPQTTSTLTLNPFTGTYNVFKNDPLQLPTSMYGTNSTTSTWGTVQDSGTAGSPITYSGGWNRTDMSTQTGQTYINQPNFIGAALVIGASKNYINISRLNFSRSQGIYASGTSTATSPNFVNITADNFASCSASITSLSSNNSTYTIKNLVYAPITISAAGYFCNGNSIIVENSLGNNTFNYVTSFISTHTNHYFQFNRIYGLGGNGTTSLTFFNTNSVTDSTFIFKNVSGLSTNTTTPITFASQCKNNKVYIHDEFSTYAGNSAAPAWISFSGFNNSVYLINVVPTRPTISNTVLAKTTGDSTNISGEHYLYAYGNTATINLTTNGSIIVDGGSYSAPSFTTVSNSTSSVRFANVAGSTSDQRTYYQNANILTDSTTRHTASGISWKMTQTSTSAAAIPVENSPLALPVAKIACNAGTLVTASVWVYRTSVDLVTKFVCPANQIAGVTTDVVATASAAINTWEQLTITFTPTQQGVVELQVDCYGAAASVYVDDFEVSQA